MPHEFEVREEITLDATPEQVWNAIATGPGIDSWFMGRNEIEPREGGTTRMTLLGATEEGTITAWEPGRRLAYRSAENPDGTFMAFEYLIEGRAGGSTVLRFVHNGFLADDWEAEYEALSKGDLMYLKKLATYLKYFPGRTAAYTMFLPQPQVTDGDRVWEEVGKALGLSGTPAEGDRVRIAVEGLDPVDGVVAFATVPGCVAVRTADGLYLFVHGYQDTIVVEYHGYADDGSEKETEQAWQNWLTRTFA